MNGLSLLLAALCLAGPAPATGCDSESIDARERVVHVYDGDTVKLKDGRTLRLIGLDTPELTREDRPAEPLADTAHETLEKLIRRDARIGLQYDRQRHDRYDRTLAHVILGDGRHAARVMLERGLATLLVIPPNTRHADCYADAQRRARDENRGLWDLPRFRPITPAAVDSLSLPVYRLVRGPITERYAHERGLTIVLDGAQKPLKLFLRADEREYFGPVLDKLAENRRIEVQGWINRSDDGGYFMRLRHPSALQILEP